MLREPMRATQFGFDLQVRTPTAPWPTIRPGSSWADLTWARLTLDAGRFVRVDPRRRSPSPARVIRRSSARRSGAPSRPTWPASPSSSRFSWRSAQETGSADGGREPSVRLAPPGRRPAPGGGACASRRRRCWPPQPWWVPPPQNWSNGRRRPSVRAMPWRASRRRSTGSWTPKGSSSRARTPTRSPCCPCAWRPCGGPRAARRRHPTTPTHHRPRRAMAMRSPRCAYACIPTICTSATSRPNSRPPKPRRAPPTGVIPHPRRGRS